MAVRFSELYFLFFFTLWVYSRRRSAAFYVGWLVLLLGAVTLYDYVRGYDEIWPLVARGWLIPAIYLTFHLLLPMIGPPWRRQAGTCQGTNVSADVRPRPSRLPSPLVALIRLSRRARLDRRGRRRAGGRGRGYRLSNRVGSRSASTTARRCKEAPSILSIIV